MLIYDVLHKEKVYHAVASDLRSLGVKYRFKKSMLKSERPETCKDISKKVFKTPLFYQALDIVNLSSGAIVHIPVFVIQASTFLEEHVAQEGLFRKAGSQARQRELISRLNNGGGLGDKNHAIDIANCLKSFFRDLPEPLIPYAYHDLFVHCALLKSHRIQALLLACTLLPPYHLNTLAFFMEFLKKVSMYEKQNKMSIDNLAKVIGPNIMPLQETSMSAVQNRLQMHLTIVKILIENAEDIGVLPPHIAQNISTETSGSTDNGLDSFELHRKHKKKKHRSGSLTRMFNGLKKIVGKGADTPNDTSNINEPQSLVHLTQLNVAPNKFTKKRKVIEREYPPSIKKKRTTEKLDKSKKLRLSLDKFVPKNKQKNVDGNLSDSYMGNYKTCNERRWSSVSNSFDTHKIKCEYNDRISNMRSKKYDEPSNNDFRQEYNDVFINATVDLSDDGGEQDLLMNKSHKNGEQWHINVSTSSRKLDATDESDNICLLTPEEKTDSEEFTFFPSSDIISSLSDHYEEDYVRIRKSEYEDIKNRVSAIESRISQEFGCIYNEKDDITTHSLNNIQTAYEKTLEEASIENTLTSDYLAKRLSKELKIRRSGEHKIIRSPSARKIGSLRRRSQEKAASKRIRRTASWHISPEFNLQHHVQLERQVNVCPIEKQSIYSNKYLKEHSHSAEKCNENISNNMRDEIACLHNQINTLISRSSERKISNNSDLDLSGFKDLHLNNNHTTTSVRRASSFHGKDFVDNSSYFDKKIDELKKANSHQNIALNNDCLLSDKTVFEGSNKISWKDADKYFKSVSRRNTPAPQTGRASVAKLRTQNAGMVLAKARLFDEGTTKRSEFKSSNVSNRKHCLDNVNKHSPNVAKEINTECFKQTCNRTQVSRKKSNKDSKNKNRHAVSSPNASPRIKTQIIDASLKSFQNGLNEHYVRKFELQDQKCSNKEPIVHQTFTKDKGINVAHDTKIQKENIAAKGLPLMKMPVSTTLENPNMSPYKSDVSKTPHIKRPLTVKTPKSSKLVRRPPVDTRRTPLKATAHLGTPKRQSPKSILKTRTLIIEVVQGSSETCGPIKFSVQYASVSDLFAQETRKVFGLYEKVPGTKMREAGIMLISTALTCVVIGNAYYQRKQFYPTVVHITKSNPSMTVIYTQGFILAFMINAFLRKIFFGTLRAAELEHLVEKVWYAVTETCLAFTVFRDDFSPKFIALFTLLLFLKSFHWLAEDRVDYMERSPVITWLFHLRVATLLNLLFVINIMMINYAYDTTATKGPSVQLVFGFEYAILLTVLFNITVKYVLHTIDLQSETPWDNKPVFLLYTELIIGVLKVFLYFAFVTLMIKLFTLPLFALRPMYYTMRDFKKALHDIVMSRRAIRNMNTLYPDATTEELAAADNVCIICREEMVTASKKLPCNHIFHTACLRSWFQRQQTCPTCRLNILRPTPNNTRPRQQNPPQPGPQVPPQPPQAPGVNPIGPPFHFPVFWAGLPAPGMPPQQQQQQQQPQQQQPQQQQQQPQNNAGSTPPQNPIPPTGNIPLFPPLFPTIVPLPPIPVPPPNLIELSEEELRAMEGNLRQAVEARIQTLQRIQLLLDAANAMMNQYQTAAATANIPVNNNSTSNTDSTSDTSTMPGPSGTANTSNGINSDSSEVKVENTPTPSTSKENTPTPSISKEDTSACNDTVDLSRTESSSEQEMLRRRRLQKFSSPPTE